MAESHFVRRVWSVTDECLARSNRVLESQSSSLRLRRATKDDAGRVLGLVRGLAEYEREPNAVVATVDDYVRDGLGATTTTTCDPIFHCVLLEDAKTEQACGLGMWYYYVSGWCSCSSSSSSSSSGTRPVLYLEDLFVEPEHRRRGGGKALMFALAGVALRLSRETTFEWQALDWNTPALGFYRSIGAEVVEGLSTFRLERYGISETASVGLSDVVVSERCGDDGRGSVRDAVDDSLAVRNASLRATGSDFSLRRVATLDDAIAVSDLLSRLRPKDKDKDKDDGGGLRDALLEDVSCRGVLLERDGVPCGVGLWFLGYSSWEGTVLCLDTVFVDKEHRRRGGGAAVVRALADVARRLGWRRIVWHRRRPETTPDQIAARRFFDTVAVGARTMDGWSTLRMDRDSTARFLATRSDEP